MEGNFGDLLVEGDALRRIIKEQKEEIDKLKEAYDVVVEEHNGQAIAAEEFGRISGENAAMRIAMTEDALYKYNAEHHLDTICAPCMKMVQQALKGLLG